MERGHPARSAVQGGMSRESGQDARVPLSERRRITPVAFGSSGLALRVICGTIPSGWIGSEPMTYLYAHPSWLLDAPEGGEHESTPWLSG